MKPKKLTVGDTIAILSPASAVAAYVPRRLQRGIETLERMGFQVLVMPNTTAVHSHTAGTIGERIQDLHMAFADPSIKAIITTIGGFNSHQLLDELDYDLIRNNPKIFMGYSDITALHAGIYAKTGLTTFIGPAILPQFGQLQGLDEYTQKWFEKTLMQTGPIGQIEASDEWTDEVLRWDVADDRKRTHVVNDGYIVAREGKGTGPILAGNLGTLLLLAGTPYMPSFDGVVLMLEDDESETPETIDRYFTQLRHLGAYDKISALVVGRFSRKVDFDPDFPLKDIILRATRGYDFPVVLDADFGHTDPVLTLPNGIQATVEANETVILEILESAVE
ncbi:LD-carboxypeptidase [Exiguobacterium antarcticum]|uniref:LD-carboxypeptidase n=1 Tax=Exiguobacterium antarcticum TaxID=132920 RepID=A0ABT6R346_9BACL|nr:S66 peptidase family protein [Exiguobacterium antarcticum]MDI3234731.1 LD-carboxypeptidase [Exiguobacterium antarcticum]